MNKLKKTVHSVLYFVNEMETKMQHSDCWLNTKYFKFAFICYFNN